MNVAEMFKNDSFSQLRAVHPIYMIDYLQAKFSQYKAEEEKIGSNDRIVQKQLDSLIACKEMVEAMIGMPVNLQQDGSVTVGF